MAQLTLTLLFAALASAQTSNYTTTAWMTNFAGSNKYGYVASVINADAQHMTLALDFDADTDKNALHLGGPGGNYTFGPSGFTLKQAMTRYELPSGDPNLAIACSEPAQTTDDVTCTGILGDAYARFARCNEYQTTGTNNRQEFVTTTTYPHTYGTGLWGSEGTETITRAVSFPAQTETTTPAWCTSDEVPESVLTDSYTTTASEFAVYQIVIYAGQEKLSAYSGSSAVTGTASGSNETVPAATGGSGTAAASATTSAPAESTGAAGKLSAVVPALAGMGVAAVMGML